MFFKDKIKNLIRCISFVALLFSSIVGKAQIMPVAATVIMNPPNSPFLSDYYGLESNAFQSFLTLNDLNEPSWNVRLIIRIEGQGIVLETKRTYVPLQPINLLSGVPLIISGADLAPYLSVNNLNLQGISAATLNQNGKLPEGAYQFCVEVLDYQTGIPLSFRSCGSAFIFYENPPVLLAPACQVAIQPTEPQNVFFNWQMSGGASPTITATSKYKLFVYELQDENENPYYAVQNNKALLIFESDFQQSTSQTIDFGISNSAPLIPGKRYIYRVRALDADEKNIYKNDGYSEFCWFFYGYPQDGVIALNTPSDARIFTKTENKLFNWETSTKAVPGQEFEYVLVIKEKNSGQTKEQAMDNNAEWFLVNKPATTSMSGGDFLLTNALESGKNYVWQVKAMTGTQQVAQSPIREFYAPSEIDQFLAGNFPVKIVTLSSGFTKSGTSYSNVSGKGRIQLSADPNDFVDADFSGITVQDISGTMYMTAGSFPIDLSARDRKELLPVLPENGPAYFYYANAIVDKTGLKMNGRVEWPFPLATSASELQVVKTKSAVFVLNSAYALNGETTMDAAKTYNLLEPHDLVISLDAATKISIYGDKYSLNLNGNILTNADVKTNNSLPYAIKIYQQPQLFYFNASNLLITSTNYLKPIAGLNMGLMPKSAVIDFSDGVSPDKLSSNPAWKGIYFPEFQVRLFKADFDNSNQIVLPANIDYFEDLTANDFWISNKGLQFKYQFNSDETGIFFNKFRTAINGKIKITDNEVSESSILGSIKIPIINETDQFAFEVPINTTGLQLGYLSEDLTLRDITFNPFGGENRVNIVINRAVFADNERLDLEINAEVVGFNAQINNISDFRIYGDNVIGVGSRNGSKKLDTRVTGTYNGFNAYITDVGASLYNGNYVFSYISEMDLGEDVAGQAGPPLLAVSSVSPAGSGVELPTYSISSPQPAPAIEVPSDPAAVASQTITPVQMFIAINNSIVDIKGYLTLRSNDPVWGNAFAGGIDGVIKLPTIIKAGANMILGNKDGLKFWYFDAWFNDTKGVGLSVGGLFNITAMEGRIYHHMSKSDGQFMIDPNLAFGGAIYLQVIDPAGGKSFAADIGAELQVFEDGEFTLRMNGSASLMNVNGRTPGAGGAISAAGQAVVTAAVESVGPLTLNVDVAGGTLAIEAKSLKAGSLLYTKSDYSIGISADVSTKPGLGFTFAKGATNFKIDADASGEFGLGVGFDGNNIALGLTGSSGGYLDLSISGAVLKADINRLKRTGNFMFGYDGKEIGIGVTATTGDLNLKLSPTRSFNAGFNTAGSAYIGLQYDDNSFSLKADKVAKSGSLEMTVSGVQLALAANATEKSAAFSLNTSGIGLQISGKKDVGGEFHLATNDFNIDLTADLPTRSGSLGFAFDGGNKSFLASLDGGTQGALKLKIGAQEFGISGNSNGTAGSVSYKDGSNEFLIAADRTAGTGSLNLNLGGNGLRSSIGTDTSFVNFNYSNYSFGVGVTSAGSGGLTYADGSNSLGIFGNPSAKTGSLDLTFSGNRIALSTDIPNKRHSILVDAAGVLFKAKTSTELKELSVGYENYLVTIAKSLSTSGSGGSAGSISYADGKNTFSLAADPDAGSGSMTIDLDGNGVSSSIDSDTAFVNFNYEGYAFATGVSSGGTGAVKYSDPNNSFQLIGNPTQKFGSIDLMFSGNRIAMSTDIPNKVHSILVDAGGVLCKAKTSPALKELSFGYQNHLVTLAKSLSASGSGGAAGSISYADGKNTFSLSADPGAGSGSLVIDLDGNGVNSSVSPDSSYVNFNYEGYAFSTGISAGGTGAVKYSDPSNSFQLVGNPTQQRGSIDLTFSGNHIAMATDIPNKIHSIDVASSGVTFNAATSPTDKSLSLAFDGFAVFAKKQSSDYEVGLTINDRTIEGGLQASVPRIAYRGDGVDLALSTNKMALSISGKKLEVSTAGVFIDGVSAGAFVAGANASYNLQVGMLNTTVVFNSGEYTLSFAMSGNSFAITTSDFSDGSLLLSVSGNSIGMKRYNGKYTLSVNDIEASYEPGILSLQKGTDRKLMLNGDELSLAYDGYNMSVSPSAFNYSDGQNAASISADGLALSRDDKELFVGPSNFGLKLGAGKDLTLTKTSIAVNYDNFSASYASNGPISAAYDAYSFIYDAGKLTLQNGTQRKLEVSTDGLSVNFDGYALNATPSAFNYSDGQNSASISAEGLSLARDDKALFVGPANFGLKLGEGKSLTLTKTSIDVNYDKFSASYTARGPISASFDTYGFAYDAGKLTLQANAQRKLEISSEGLGVNFDGYALNASPTQFTYSDGTNTAAISASGLALGIGSNSLFISPDRFGLDIGGTKHVYLTRNSLDVKYDNYQAAFSTTKSLSFSDGTRSFALSPTGLEMNDGDKRIAVIDDGGKPAIELKSGTNLFQLSQRGFAVEFGGKRYAVNDQEFLKIEIDAQRRIEVMNNGVKYVDGTTEFILGGDDNLVELKDDTRSIALSKTEKLVMKDGAYMASLSKQLEVEFTDGVRSISLLKGTNYLTYAQSGYSFGIRGANGGKPGIDFSNGDYSFFLEGVRNKDVTVGVTSAQFGTFSATVNSQNNILASLSTSATQAYGFAVKNGKLNMINGTAADPVPEQLAGAPSIPASDGPQYLTNSISADAGGSIKGTADIFFDSRNQHFMMSAAVAGNKPVCIKGAMALDVSPGNFSLDIGTEEQRIEVYPTCTGFGGGGWLGIHNSNLDIGVFAGWKASATVSVGSDIIGASLTAAAGAELGVRANLDLDPFKIKNAGVWIDLYAGLYAKYWAVGASGSLTIAELRLHGQLMLYFEDKTRITGSLDGSICILDIITADFGMSFDTTI